MLTTYILPRPKCDCFRNSIKLGTQLIYPFKTSFCYLVQFQLQKILKIWFLFQLRSGNYEIISIKFLLIDGFPANTVDMPRFLSKNLFWFYWIFNENIIQNSITLSHCRFNRQETTSVHPYTSRAFQHYQEPNRALWFERSQCNKPPFLIERCCPSN
jgi:hypothetical protein